MLLVAAHAGLFDDLNLAVLLFCVPPCVDIQAAPKR